MRVRVIVLMAYAACFAGGNWQIASATHPDLHHDDPHHHDPHHDPHHHDPHHDPHHNIGPHHHAGDMHSIITAPHFVDHRDLHLWHAGFGLHGSATHLQGDADGDSDIDGADFLSWQRHLGSAIAVSTAASSVPEPTSFGLLISATAVALAAKRRLSQPVHAAT